MARVFISHSDLDRKFVESHVVTTLRAANLETWYSKEDIFGGRHWEREIIKGLESSDWFLVVVSSNAVDSRWVRTEVHWAFEHRSGRIVPVLKDDVEPIKLHIALPELQFVDFRRPNSDAKSNLIRVFGELGATALTPHPSAENEIEPAAAITNFAPQQAHSAPSVPAMTKPEPLTPPRARFHCGPSVPADFFIGRMHELEEACELIDGQQSFLIVGQPRAGKTSFCHKLKQMYDGRSSPMLLSYLNLQQYSKLTIETFLEHTILNMIGEIARKLFACRYVDLKSSDPTERYPELRGDSQFKVFHDLYRHVSSLAHDNSSNSPVNSISREFVYLTQDLLDICSSRDRSGFLMFYDEANRLPLDISGDLLISIGETLSETGVTGAYVASPQMATHFGKVEQLFGSRLAVGPFQNPREMQQLLSRYYHDDKSCSQSLPISQAALDEMWTRSNGLPFHIQLIADQSFRIARTLHAERIEHQHVLLAYEKLLVDRPAAFDYK
ncbi:MAG: toll/interleukin-1 receptor domain-containing protein [Planctomycetaceae bacterium]|nr:toll/interleukin-1 receptor domain-containing protein [Planctomycetaceae bacterium]